MLEITQTPHLQRVRLLLRRFDGRRQQRLDVGVNRLRRLRLWQGRLLAQARQLSAIHIVAIGATLIFSNFPGKLGGARTRLLQCPLQLGDAAVADAGQAAGGIGVADDCGLRRRLAGGELRQVAHQLVAFAPLGDLRGRAALRGEGPAGQGGERRREEKPRRKRSDEVHHDVTRSH